VSGAERSGALKLGTVVVVDEREGLAVSALRPGADIWAGFQHVCFGARSGRDLLFNHPISASDEIIWEGYSSARAVMTASPSITNHFCRLLSAASTIAPVITPASDQAHAVAVALQAAAAGFGGGSRLQKDIAAI